MSWTSYINKMVIILTSVCYYCCDKETLIFKEIWTSFGRVCDMKPGKAVVWVVNGCLCTTVEIIVRCVI